MNTYRKQHTSKVTFVSGGVIETPRNRIVDTGFSMPWQADLFIMLAIIAAVIYFLG
jgi:hypothetical protein